jgi:hypothetical protein
MKPPVFEQWTLNKLHGFLMQRCFAIPKLQRNFVWDASRAAKLLDSMYRAMPIGSLFLWEMDRKSANLIRQSDAELLPPFSSNNSHVWFVIDGQQRLSVLHQAFKGETKANDRGSEIDFGRICLVVHPDWKKDTPARILHHKPIEGEYIPICEILAPDWRRQMPSRAKGFLAKVSTCRNLLLKYPVPVVIVRSATLKEIGEVFVRVNSQGMRITSADRAIALMGRLDVRAMAQELRQKVRDEVFVLGTIDPILMGFNLISERPTLDGDPPKLDLMAQRWSKKLEQDKAALNQFKKQWYRYRNAFLASVDYLRQRFFVYDESFLPSANMLAILAVFFYYHRGQPNRFQAGEIRKWFWTTGVAKRYSGAGYHRNIVADARLFESLANNTIKRFTFGDYLDPVFDIQGEAYNSGSARSRAFFCLLAAQEPRYLENGEPIQLSQAVVSLANRKDRHHVFPQAQLRKHFNPRFYNSLCNICFLVSRDNERIGSRLPCNYLASYRDANRKAFYKAMKSHLIPVRGDSGVWEQSTAKAFKGFRSERLALICKAFESEAGIRLFRRN